MNRAVTPFGVYVHIPFCARRCDYCAFATWTDRDHLVGPYMGALAAEIDSARASGMPGASSVFFGGGTPSLVPARSLMAVLDRIELVPHAEVTVECNPDTITSELVDAYLTGGVNRISLGVQSMDRSVLGALGRTHDPDNVVRAVELVREGGFTDFNVDLIYGAAGESTAMWRATVEAALALGPTHISAYALTVESGTPLSKDPGRHPDDDDMADKYLIADEMLGKAGFDWYEISNWARDGHRCRHNFLYWDQGEYRGFGCAAHSHGQDPSGPPVGATRVRWWNVRLPERYISSVADGVSSEAGRETLDSEARRIERLQLELRTSRGVPVDSFDPEDLELLDGFLEHHGDRLVLSRRGRLMANEVSLRLR